MLPIPVMPTEILASCASARQAGAANTSVTDKTAVTIRQDLGPAPRQSFPGEYKLNPNRVRLDDDDLCYIPCGAIAAVLDRWLGDHLKIRGRILLPLPGLRLILTKADPVP